MSSINIHKNIYDFLCKKKKTIKHKKVDTYEEECRRKTEERMLKEQQEQDYFYISSNICEYCGMRSCDCDPYSSHCITRSYEMSYED